MFSYISIVFIIFTYWLFRYIVVPLILAIINFQVLTLSKKHIKIIKESGKWAIVTGSTDGIGREYCRQLAKLGLNIFLISRDEAKLEITSKELKHYYKIDVKYFKADFTLNSIYEHLNEELKDLDVGVLVNNVGMTQNYPCNFHDLDSDLSFLSKMINCNILSAIAMAKIILPGMCCRNRGIIINISSASVLLALPMSALYSSTKTFLNQFSQTTSKELSSRGIIVQTVLPFYVQTKFIGKFHPPSLFTHTAEEYVESAIKTVGIEKYTHGTLCHTIQGIITGSVPNVIKTIIGARIQKARSNACKKDE